MANFKYYIAGRFLQAIFLLVFIMTFSFIIIQSAPGNPIQMIAGIEGVPVEYMRMKEAQFGLDRPIHLQLLSYFSNILKGDLGYSYTYGTPVLKLFLSRVRPTLLLMGIGFVFALLVGIPLGIMASTKPYSLFDNIASLISSIGIAVPSFWAALLLILVFTLNLKWFPSQGITDYRLELFGLNKIIDMLKHLVLPVISVGTSSLAIYTRLTRASMLEELRKDYITMARSKGLTERRVTYKHAFRNAMIPVVTVIGMHLGFLIGGAVLTETIFAWPGIGRLQYDAIFQRDYPVIMGILTIVAITVILANLITDILYGFLDPRIRYGDN